MKNLFFWLAAIAALQIQAQNPEDKMRSKNFPVTDFTKLFVNAPMNVRYVQADTVSVWVYGTDDDLAGIDISQKDQALSLGSHNAFKHVKVLVTAPKLKAVSCNRAASFKTEQLFGDTLQLSLDEASSANINVKLSRLVCSLNGASVLNAKGFTDKFEAVANGASSVKAYDLGSVDVSCVTSGAASAKVNASNSLMAKASGSSSIRFKGNVKDVKISLSDVSSIKRVDDSSDFPRATDTSKIDNDNNDHKHGRHGNYSGGPQNWGLYHWAGFYVGVNGLMTPDYKTAMPSQYKYMELDLSKSINLQLNLFQHNFSIYKKYISLATGLGFDWHRYAFNNQTTLNADSSFTFGTIDKSGQYTLSKNVLKYAMLQVPLLLEFNTSRRQSRNSHVSVGVVGQFMMSSKTKQEFTLKGSEHTIFHKDNYNMNPLQAKAHFSIGYSWATLYAEYNLTPMFQAGKGPMLYPFTAGIVIVPFGHDY